MEPSSARWRALEADVVEPVTTPTEPAAGMPWPVIAAAAVAALVAVVAFVVASGSTSGIAVEAPSTGLGPGIVADVGPTPSPTPGVVVVDVGGAVRSPGVYRLPVGARVGDAIAAAGGYGARVDAELADRQLNLAAIVHDGDEVHVPARGEAVVALPAGGNAAAATGGPIDLNRASAEQLDTLPGIGPVTAAKIIAAREQQPFASIDDLATRKVVGAATLERIRDLVTIGP